MKRTVLKFLCAALILLIATTLTISSPKFELSATTYTNVNVAACSTSGTRQANAKVDIGFDSTYAKRYYYGYTNSYKQLVTITAANIVLQNDSKEPVKSSGRYCSDEAKVPGVESKILDEGHGIADSLGGVSNAYNITPQNSTLNRSGQQYKMEEDIRKNEMAGRQVTDFVYNIYYPSTKTQTPSSYKVTYKVNGVSKTWSYANK